METDIKIRCCRECHVEDIQGYCNTCEKFFCQECMNNHTQHKIMKIEDLCEENNVSVYELVVQLEEERKRTEITNMLKESPVEYCIAFFIAGREDFLRRKACINCSIDEYCACDDIDLLLDVDAIMRKELIDVGQGVKMTEPIKVEKGLMIGSNIHASLSHQGILAIHARSDSKCIIQFTDLNTNRQIEMNVESTSTAGFYDSMILLLTFQEPLREASVEEVFESPRIRTFREVE